MKDLQLKQLAPYLPYGVEILQPDAEGRNTLTLDVEGLRIMEVQGFEYFKPLLHPLSRLTEEMEHNGERFVPKDKLPMYFDNSLHFLIEQIENNYVEYCVIEKLFEWHFDVFGLINKGLAEAK
jgi:hypothetical protein